MSYMQARKKAADAGKKSFKYTTKDGETRKYELVEGKKGAKIYKCVANCAEKKKRFPRRVIKKLTEPSFKIGDIVTSTNKSSRLYGKNFIAIEFFVDDGIHRVRVQDPDFPSLQYVPVIHAMKKVDVPAKKKRSPRKKSSRKKSAKKKELKRERERSRKRSRRASKKAKDCALGERYVKGKGCVMRKQSQFAGKFMPEFGGGDQCSTSLLVGHYLSRIQNAIIDLEARRDGLSLPAIKKYLNADESEYSLIKAALRRGVECGFLQKHKGKWKIKKYLKM